MIQGQDIPVLTNDGFALMKQSVSETCKEMDPNIGISVALWRLEALLQGYQYALDRGYSYGATVEP